jgi:hypothetical protein
MDRPTHSRVSLGGVALDSLTEEALARLRIESAAGDKNIRGRGYLEMTGYAGESMGAMLR